MRARTFLSLFVAVAALVAAVRAEATVMVEVPFDDMVMDADAIVLGRVEHVGVQLRMQGHRMEPWTLTQIQVERWLKDRGPDRVIIEERGGVWNGGGMAIAGTPQYAVGERVITFLRLDNEQRYRTYGMVQGRFLIHEGVPGQPAVVRRDLSAVGFVHWAGGQMRVDHSSAAPQMELDAMLSRIASVLEVLR